MFLGVKGDLERDGFEGRGGCPIPCNVSAGRVQDDPGRIVRAAVRLTLDLVGTETLLAPQAKLREREAVSETPSDVDEPLDRVRRGVHLFYQQRKQILWMKIVPDLVPGAAEPDVLQGLLVAIGVNPEGEDALVGFPELSGAGENTATIDEDGQVESEPVLQGKRLRCELRRPVERKWWLSRK